MSWASASFALLSDVALGSLGGDLKRREKLTGHLADVLSNLYLATCAIRRFESEGRRKEDEPFLRWTTAECLSRAQAGFDAALRNFPVPVLGAVLRLVVAPWSRLNALALPPTDRQGHELARAMQERGPARERLLRGDFLSRDAGDPLARLERAFGLALQAQSIADRVRQATKDGRMARGDDAHARGIITAEEAQVLQQADAAREDAVQVDAFEVKA